MDLLEKYIDHPQRDEIIAREMNWTHLTEGNARQWEEEVDAMFEQEVAGTEDEEEPASAEEESYPFESHALYRMAIEFTAEIGKIFDELDPKSNEHPASNALQTGATITAAKLAAALSDGDDVEDLGMCIAYLKRALHAINGGLNATAQLESAQILSPEQVARIRAMLFAIRDGIVTKMGECRAEFRRRHGR